MHRNEKYIAKIDEIQKSCGYYPVATWRRPGKNSHSLNISQLDLRVWAIGGVILDPRLDVWITIRKATRINYWDWRLNNFHFSFSLSRQADLRGTGRVPPVDWVVGEARRWGSDPYRPQRRQLRPQDSQSRRPRTQCSIRQQHLGLSGLNKTSAGGNAGEEKHAIGRPRPRPFAKLSIWR